MQLCNRYAIGVHDGWIRVLLLKVYGEYSSIQFLMSLHCHSDKFSPPFATDVPCLFPMFSQ